MVDVAGTSRERTCEYRRRTLNSPCLLSSWSSWDGTPIDLRVTVEVRVPFGASRRLVSCYCCRKSGLQLVRGPNLRYVVFSVIIWILLNPYLRNVPPPPPLLVRRTQHSTVDGHFRCTAFYKLSEGKVKRVVIIGGSRFLGSMVRSYLGETIRYYS